MYPSQLNHGPTIPSYALPAIGRLWPSIPKLPSEGTLCSFKSLHFVCLFFDDPQIKRCLSEEVTYRALLLQLVVGELWMIMGASRRRRSARGDKWIRDENQLWQENWTRGNSRLHLLPCKTPQTCRWQIQIGGKFCSNSKLRLQAHFSPAHFISKDVWIIVKAEIKSKRQTFSGKRFDCKNWIIWSQICNTIPSAAGFSYLALWNLQCSQILTSLNESFCCWRWEKWQIHSLLSIPCRRRREIVDIREKQPT